MVNGEEAWGTDKHPAAIGFASYYQISWRRCHNAFVRTPIKSDIEEEKRLIKNPETFITLLLVTDYLPS